MCWNCFCRLRYLKKKRMPLVKECYACGSINYRKDRWITNPIPNDWTLLLCRSCYTLIFLKPNFNRARLNELARNWYSENRAKLRLYYSQRNRLGRLTRRKQMFDYLGGKCLVDGCGIVDPRLLEFDHVNGGGRLEKRSTRKNLSDMLYQRYISDPVRFKQDFQLLCANHNKLKRYIDGEISLSKEFYDIFGPF